jgi:hypothetical protein
MELAMQAKGRRLSGSLQAPGVKDVWLIALPFHVPRSDDPALGYVSCFFLVIFWRTSAWCHGQKSRFLVVPIVCSLLVLE